MKTAKANVTELNASSVLTAFGVMDKHTAIDVLADAGHKKQRKFIEAVMGENKVKLPVNNFYVQYTSMYLMQDIVKENRMIPLTKRDYKRAYDLAAKLISKSPIAAAYNWFDPKKEAILTSGEKSVMEGSNQHKAEEMYIANMDLDRNTVLDMFVNELGLSKATATNYYYAARRKHNPNASKSNKGRKKDPNSRFNRAKKLFKEGMSRDEFIKAVTSSIEGMKTTTATNYYYKFKKGE